MPADLSTMTAASASLVLGGRTLFLSQLTLGDLGHVEAWLKERVKRPFQVAKEALEDLKGLPPDAYAEAERLILTAAHADAKAGRVSIHSSEALSHLSNSEGIALIIWLAGRKMHQLEYDQVLELVNKEPAGSLQEKIKQMIRLFQSSIRPEGDGPNPTVPAPPAGPVMQEIQIGPASTGR